MPKHETKFQFTFTEQEFAHVLASLRYVQSKMEAADRCHGHPEDVLREQKDILEGFTLMSPQQIDEFCQKLNLLKA